MVTLYIGALRVGQLEIWFILRHLGILRDPQILEISHCSILDVGDIFSYFPSSNGPPFCGASLPLQLFLLGAVSLDKSLLLLPFGVYISTHPFPPNSASAGLFSFLAATDHFRQVSHARPYNIKIPENRSQAL